MTERYRTTANSTWRAGLLNNVHIPVLEADRVALRAARVTGPVQYLNASEIQSGFCMMIFYGDSTTTITQLAACPGDGWYMQHTWTEVDGRASPAFVGWASPDSTIYAAFVDLIGYGRIYLYLANYEPH